ncbi:MAG TPA: hypothetical protein VHJ54_00760 [Solirubrobacterales bacterium]|jgi:hypothetical protein|nr:hypothetical protein [Solirubrobacterales bacterium]
MKSSRAAVYAAVAMLVVGAVGVGVVTAHTKKIKSTVSIAWDYNIPGPYEVGDRFAGNVGSKKKCRNDRLVQVKRVGGSTIGSDRTNDQGHYRVQVTGNAAEGEYLAKVQKKVIKRNAKHKHVCKKAISPKITVPSVP